MAKKFLVCLICVALIVAIMPISSFAELKFKGGPYLRLRHEYLKNNFDLDKHKLDNRNYFRIKASLWGQADFNKDLSLYAKLTDEFRAYTYYAPSSSKSTGKTDKYFHFDINEVIFENLYLDVRNLLQQPLDLRLGRQDLSNYGENFLIYDGTSGDGKDMYFNAAKAVWRMDDKNSLELIYINNPRDDELLPVINEDKAPQNKTTTDEQAGVLYLRNKPNNNLATENYYIYKREGEDGGTGYQAQKGKINTLGSFAKYSFNPYTLRTQLAYQFGTYGTKDRKALGGYAFLDREFKHTWKPQVSLGFIYLSGDDRDTTRNEAWDPLFNRTGGWMTELYANTIKLETAICAYWTNLQMWRTSLVLAPTNKMKLSFFYNYLRPVESVAMSITNNLAGKKGSRGHLPQARVDYAFNKNISAYFLAEYFIPGSFYIDRDAAIFLRTQLELKF